MFRILITFGSVALEILTSVTEGAVAISMLLAGVIITVIHLTSDSAGFQKIVNRLTGFDLPETLETLSSTAMLQCEEQTTGRSSEVR